MTGLMWMTMIWGLGGCGQRFTEDQALDLFTVLWMVANDVADDVQQELDAEGGSPTAKDLTVTDGEGEAAVSGTVEGDGDWTGTITVDGTAAWSESSESYALELELADVHTDDPDITLNGGLAAGLDSTVDGSTWHSEFSLAGSLSVTGEAEGTADFDFTVTVDLDTDAMDYSYSASGTLAGHDVEGMTGSL